MNEEQPDLTGGRFEIEMDKETAHWLHVYTSSRLSPRPTTTNYMKRRLGVFQIVTRVGFLLLVIAALLILVRNGAH